MLAQLSVLVLHLYPQARSDAPLISTPNVCKQQGQVTRTRGVQINDIEAMGLRSCLRGFQTLGLALHRDVYWWTFGTVPVTAGHSEDGGRGTRLVRHRIERGTLADGTIAIVQIVDVLTSDRCADCDPPLDDRAFRQSINVCALPVNGVAQCGSTDYECPADGCGAGTLEHGVIRIGDVRIDVTTY